jgi:hypothetical protein
MLWLNHPAYTQACATTLDALKGKRARLKRIRPIVFLCGAKNSARRDRLSEYLHKYTDNLIFYAEEVFDALIRGEPEAIALELEGELADLADAIVVIAESPGTFAELGAFAINDQLRRKLLPIADRDYKHFESFLKTGPIRWADKDSLFGPTIWADFSVLLSAADEIKQRLDRIYRPRAKDIRKLDIRGSRRHLLFLLILIVEVFGPLSGKAAALFLEEIVGTMKHRDMLSLLALGEALKLIKVAGFEGEALYFRSRKSGQLGQMTRITPFAIATMRAKVLSAMQGIPSACKALDFLAESQSSAA